MKQTAIDVSEQRIWLVKGERTLSYLSERLIPQSPVTLGCLDDVLGRSRPGETVVLTGLSPDEAVTASECLLASGLTVLLDASAVPALNRVLAKNIWGIDVVKLSPGPPAIWGSAALRARDIILAGLALLCLSPVLAILALLVKRSSPGPVLYRTAVVGRDGRTFVWSKLRSMRVGNAQDDLKRREQYRAFLGSQPKAVGSGASTKIVDESRITPIGRVLRRHSLDELPQLWNVLRGEMTLVGPRPCLPYEYEMQAPWHRLRYRATPGLTGPWQAYGRSRVTVDEMALIDYCYTRLKSFWLDLRIILRTVRVVVNGEGGK